MSTNSIQTGLQQPLPKLDGMRVAIVSTLWNAEVTDRLRDGALEVFRSEGFDESTGQDLSGAGRG